MSGDAVAYPDAPIDICANMHPAPPGTMSLDLPPSVPTSGGPLTRAIGRSTLRLMGWRVEGRLPNVRKMVVIVAPHTSNWDFIVGLATKFALGLDASWLGKHTLFRGPFGWLFRSLGGIPVDRSASHQVVADAAEAFERKPAMVLALAPEGTRRNVGRWRTGFWHIARKAGVPIVPVTMDWRTRAMRIGRPLEARDDVDAEVAAISAGFHRTAGRNGAAS